MGAPATRIAVPGKGRWAVNELAEVRGSDLEAVWRVSCTVDELVEVCQRDHLGLRGAFRMLGPRLEELLGVEGIALSSLDEQLEAKLLIHGSFGTVPEERLVAILEKSGAGHEELDDGRTLLHRAFDAAGAFVGGLAVLAPPDWSEARRITCGHQLHAACEELDNYVHAIQQTARKQLLVERIQQALRHEVLAQAIDDAVSALNDEVPRLRMGVLYFDTSIQSQRLRYRVFENGRCTVDSQSHPIAALDALLDERDLSVSQVGNALIEEVFGETKAVESVMVEGLKHQETLGMVIFADEGGGLNVFTMDLLRLFSGSLSQRLVDYNRERRVLERSFPMPIIRRLLAEPNYADRYLSPREETVAVLFADISSFTAISEQILEDPQRIGDFVDGWARKAVDALYAQGGVFDKMIGDCIIGLFGPPFFDESVGSRSLAALRAAWEINRVTAEYAFENVEEELVRREIQPGLGVATGINLAPMHVGSFGPNADFTCFAQGMNNCARLQGVAGFREILLAREAYEALEEFRDQPFLRGLTFEGPREAKVKNVAHPLVFHSVTFTPEGDDRR